MTFDVSKSVKCCLYFHSDPQVLPIFGIRQSSDMKISGISVTGNLRFDALVVVVRKKVSSILLFLLKLMHAGYGLSKSKSFISHLLFRFLCNSQLFGEAFVILVWQL